MTQVLNSETLATSNPVAVIDRAALSQAVALATLAIEKRNTVPILSNVRITGHGESMEITGTNLDTEIKAKVAGAADSRFAVTAPAHMLKDIFSKARASEMASLDHGADDERATVDLGGVKFKLQTLPAVDFPDMEAPAHMAGFELPVADLVKAFDRCSFAMSTEETRYYLNGIHLHPRRASPGAPVTLRAVSTDGHRLAMYDLTTAINGKAWGKRKPGSVIIMRHAVKLFLKAVDMLRKGKAAPETVRIEVAPLKVRFTFGHVTMTCKTIDGTFPDYARVVPRYNDKVAVMNVAAMVDAVTQVNLISQDKGRKVAFTFAGGKCGLMVNNPDAGIAETEIAADLNAGFADHGPMTIGFNGGYVLDCMAELSGDSFAIALNDPGCPAVIDDPADLRFRMVLMPMRV